MERKICRTCKYAKDLNTIDPFCGNHNCYLLDLDHTFEELKYSDIFKDRNACWEAHEQKETN